MKTILSVAIATLLLAQSTANTACGQERGASGERSFDIQKRRTARAPQRSAMVILGDATSAKVTLEQVGDPDSFGRKVKYLGVASTDPINLLPDCTGFDTSFGERCLPLAPAPQSSSFDEADLARIELPAKAANSLLCFTISPLSRVRFENSTAAPRTAQLQTIATVVIENAVLNDPALIDPNTGQPFGGQVSFGLTLSSESRTLAAGAFESRFDPASTRSCIGGLVSKQFLVDLGLTERQANQFFRNPITLRFGALGVANSVTSLDFFYGVRIYGD